MKAARRRRAVTGVDRRSQRRSLGASSGWTDERSEPLGSVVSSEKGKDPVNRVHYALVMQLSLPGTDAVGT